MNVQTLAMLFLVAASGMPVPALAQDCVLGLSPAQIDFGHFNRTTLQTHAGELPLPVRRMALSLLCDQAQDLTIIYHAPGTAALEYALGDQGKYELSVRDAWVDDQPVQWAQASTGTPGMAPASSIRALQGGPGIQPMRAGSRVRGRHLRAVLEVRAALAPAVMAAANAQAWLASGSVEIAGQQRHLQFQVGFAPAACRPTVSAGGRIDFGRVNAGSLSPAQVTSFSREAVLDIDCDAATRFALRAVDNRAGSASDAIPATQSTLFGIGHTANGRPLGGFTLRMGTGTGRDGASASLLLGEAAARTWRPSPDQWVRHDGQASAFAMTSGSSTDPGAWLGLSVPLTIDLHLPPASTLDLTQETLIDGSATLEIIYL